MKALRLLESGKADFADCPVARSALAAGRGKAVTFGEQASKAGMALLK